MIRKRRQQKRVSKKRRAEKKFKRKLDKRVEVAVDKVVAEYGEVLHKLGNE